MRIVLHEDIGSINAKDKMRFVGNTNCAKHFYYRTDGEPQRYTLFNVTSIGEFPMTVEYTANYINDKFWND